MNGLMTLIAIAIICYACVECNKHEHPVDVKTCVSVCAPRKIHSVSSWACYCE